MNYRGFIIIDDDIVFECSLDEIRDFMEIKNNVQARKEEDNFAYIAQWLRAYVTRHWFESSAKR